MNGGPSRPLTHHPPSPLPLGKTESGSAKPHSYEPTIVCVSLNQCVWVVFVLVCVSVCVLFYLPVSMYECVFEVCVCVCKRVCRTVWVCAHMYNL